MTLWIHIFVQRWNSFPEELKTTKQIVFTNATEGLFAGRGGGYKIINITRQNLHFAHILYNKKKFKMAAKEGLD